MMYQRDMCVFALAQQAQQRLDDRMERRVGAEEEDGEEGGHEDDHDAALDRLLLSRPDDLRGFRADLLEELAWTDLRHYPHLRNMRNRPNDPAFPDPNRPNEKPG